MSKHLKWRKAKSAKEQPLTDPRQNASDQYKRDISGDLHVRGEVETKFPPNLIEKHDAERKEDSARDNKRFVVEILTLVAVAIYAGLAFWQGCETHRLADLAQSTFDAANRPYIGIDAIAPYFVGKNNTRTKEPTADTIDMDFTVVVKNFGPVPGTSYNSHLRVTFGGVEVPHTHEVPDKPTTFFPSEHLSMANAIGKENYPALMDGSKALILDVTIEYDGPKRHYKECERNQFSPLVNAFLNLGPCP